MKKLFLLLFIVMCTQSVFSQNLDKTHYQKSLDFFNNNQLESAFSEVNLFLLENPNDVDGLNLRAFYFRQLKEPERAIEDYSHVLRIDKTNMASLTNRALLYMELERYTLALKDLNTKVDLSPKAWTVYFDRAYCLALKGDHEKALLDFNKAIDLNPENASAYANRGFTKINMISNDGLIRPAPEQCVDACIDLHLALEMGDSTVVRMIDLYCE